MMDFTPEERAAALDRLMPYLEGYPEGMIDSRRWAIASGKATPEVKREIACEDQIVREIKEARGY